MLQTKHKFRYIGRSYKNNNLYIILKILQNNGTNSSPENSSESSNSDDNDSDQKLKVV